MTDDAAAATVIPPPVVVTDDAPVDGRLDAGGDRVVRPQAADRRGQPPAAEAATATAAASTVAVIDALSVARTSTPVPAEIEPPVTVARACEAPVVRS